VEAGADVRLVGPAFDKSALRTARDLRVPVIRCPAAEVRRGAFASADAVVVIADDRGLGRALRPLAERRHVLFYAGDDPEVSDWVQPAIRTAGPISIAVSTGGRSPIVARALAERLSRSVRSGDRIMVRLQGYARDLARERIPSAHDRRRILLALFEDPQVRAACARADLAGARALARRRILRAPSRGPSRLVRLRRSP
jgi:siroheme synthase-like protein